MEPLLAAADVFFSALQGWAYWKLIGAFFVGVLGSAAYITALYFKFIGVNNEQRDIVLEPFRRRLPENGASIRKCAWYSIVGGCIAVVFQYDVPNFVAVQSLILGATWPAVVSQFLSGRMVSPSREELEAITVKSSVPISAEYKVMIKNMQENLPKRPRKRT